MTASSFYSDSVSNIYNTNPSIPPYITDLYNSSKSTYDNSFGLGNLSGSSSENNVNNWYLEEYQRSGDKAYLETYIQNALAQQNTDSAREWEAGGYQRQINGTLEALKENGLNPWLAVQGGIPGVSSGSSSSASYSSKNISQEQTEKSKDRASNVGKAVLTGIILALVKALL